jgi:DNA polymerase I-like protein with 3'-5' exonuclease and polymerase domains
VPKSNWEPPAELLDLRQCSIWALDLETKDDGLARGQGAGWPLGAGYIAGVAYATLNSAGYIPLRGPQAFPLDNVVRWLSDHRHVPTVFHNSPYDVGWLSTVGVEPPHELHDTMAMTVHIDENRLDFSLDGVCRWQEIPGKDKRLLNEAAAAYGIKPEQVMNNLWRLPNEYVGPYAEQDARSTLELFHKLKPLLEEQGTWNAYRCDCDLVSMVVAMRKLGIRVDVDLVEQTASRIMQDADAILHDIGRRLNLKLSYTDILSSQRLEPIFIAEGVPYPRTPPSKRFPTGQPSFESDWMKDSEHWLPKNIATARALRDAAEKFLRGYILEYSNNGRIHAEIHAFRSPDGGTRSHRLSYSNPPLQQMPSLNPKLASAIRGVFLPEQGQEWGIFDYSQQEPRLTVHYAVLTEVLGWQEALEYYTAPGSEGDYHTMVSKLTGIPRPRAKIINLALAYGMGVALLASKMGVSVEEAGRVMKIYHDRVPFVRRLTDECSKWANRRGYIQLLDGARCHFDLWEPQRWHEGESWGALPRDRALDKWKGRSLKRAFTHKAFNRLIQGGAARQTKMAMRELWRQGKLPMLQMHDDLNFSLDRGDTKWIKDTVEVMKTVVPIKVPMKVDVEIGPSWGNVEKVTT